VWGRGKINVSMSNILYLSQSYFDAQDDFSRSLSGSIPTWDYVILTASNEHQARSFRLQIEARKEYLPQSTKFIVLPDEGGVRIGSGGATLAVLRYLNGGWPGKRVLVIHSGGDSKRIPQYSAHGKLFSPVPHVLPDGRSATLFDELLIAMAAVPSRIREGMLLLSGDVLLLFNPLLIDYAGSGAAVISFKERVETGKNHGVYLYGEDGNVRSFLHKQSEEMLRSIGAVDDCEQVDIDTGAIILGTDVLDSLFSLISTDGMLDGEKYRAFVNDRVCLSLYGDFQYPMATDSTLESYYNEKSEGTDTRECRKAIWKVLRPYRLKMLRLAPAKFIHFGTSKEVLRLYTAGVRNYSSLGWSRTINSAGAAASYNSVIEDGARIGKDVYVETSYIHGTVTVGSGSIISYVDLEDVCIPANVVLHGLEQTDGKFVCRIYGVEDNPKENKLFGRTIPVTTLWDAPIYPERENMQAAVDAALHLYSLVLDDRWDKMEHGKSLSSGFNEADPEAIIAWDKRMGELVSMEKIAALIRTNSPAKGAKLGGPLTKTQREWLERKLCTSDLSTRMRLHFYVGKATGDEREISRAFSCLSSAIQASALSYNALSGVIAKDHVEVSLPLRVNFGGGWSDTPPYCIEKGGTVLNAAVLLNGDRPVKVMIQRIEDKKIVLDSRDIDAHGEFTDLGPLQSVGNPYDPFVLQKAALLATGVIPASGGILSVILDQLGGGFVMNTEVVGVPKGSGLGTSSILAAAVVKGIFEFVGRPYTEEEIYSMVLVVEQIMSTGGGWQDQVGGLTDGVKFITSKPGLSQDLQVTHLALDPQTMQELDSRFCLIYTGQRRLARNLLRDVVGRYIGNEPDAVYALNEIQKIAALMRFELERGNVDGFAELLSVHWELSKMLDAGSTNPLIDQIFDSIEDLVCGKMICGAGGGGFLQVVLRKDVEKEKLQERLKSVFVNTAISVWDCELV